METTLPSFIKQVNLRYYKSIGSCQVDLDALTVLVGRNGSGKSNFIDSLSFVSDALSSTLDFAIRQRGGLGTVRKRSGGHPTNFSISLKLLLPSRQNCIYSFIVSTDKEGRHKVKKEYLLVSSAEINPIEYSYSNGILDTVNGIPMPKQISDDRLALQIASTFPETREVYDVLSSARFYNIYPEDFRLPQPHDSGEFLLRTGRNIAAVIRAMKENNPENFTRVCEYLSRIVTEISGIDYKSLGPSETIEFLQAVAGQQHPWRFFAAQMSDGTLRSLGILVALFQQTTQDGSGQIVGIEEPEATIHPAACAILTDAIIESASTKQIIITTHSPDLIDHPGIDIDSIRIVNAHGGDTTIQGADDSSREIVKRQLMTAGELLRQDQLAPKSSAPVQFSFLNRL